MAAQTLNEVAFAKEFAKRLGLDPEQKADLTEARRILTAFKDEVTDCLVNGYKVTLTNFVRFEPRFSPAKAMGEMVNVPGRGQQPRAKAEPAGFKAKAFTSESISAAFPSIRSKAGQELAATLDPSQQKPASVRPKAEVSTGSTPRKGR
jgi:nucleoid DNA-binding protein